MGVLDYNVSIDRDSALFDMQINYTIPQYIDPETGENFSDTSWTATLTEVGVSSGGFSGFGSESETVYLNLGLAPDSGLHRYALDFNAMNTFSADSVFQRWTILSAAYSTDEQSLLGTAGTDILIGGSADDVLRGNGDDDVLDGGGGDDILDGGAGNDRLDGGLGQNILKGGAGTDIYIVNSLDDIVVEFAGGGGDGVLASISYTLGAEVESLSLVGAGPIDGTGNAGGNFITGNGFANILSGLDGNDRLEGGEGKDTLSGGAGVDTLVGGQGNDMMAGGTGDDDYYVDATGDTIVEGLNEGNDRVYTTAGTYTLAANLETMIYFGFMTFHGIGNTLANSITGGVNGDTLDGLGGADTLIGAGGNDVLTGGAGADRLDGGAGVDRADYATSAGRVAINLATGAVGGGDAAGDVLIGIENLTGSALADILRGDGGANMISGLAGNDEIRGADGNDMIIGGAGADTLYGDAGIDVLSYATSAGAVTVNLLTGVHAGGDAQGDIVSGFENLYGSEFADTLSGNDAANTLYGRGGIDTIAGNGGNDVIIGGAGADLLTGGAGIDTLSYGSATTAVSASLATGTGSGGDAQGDIVSGFENLTGGAAGDTLTGDGGANTLTGGAGDDLLAGGAGNDRLTGGLGDDHFAFATGGGADILTDFLAGNTSAELLHLSLGTAFDSFSEVMAVATSSGAFGGNTVFRFDANTTLTLLNVDIGSLDATDFVFG